MRSAPIEAFLHLFRWQVGRHMGRSWMMAVLNAGSIALGVAVFLAIQIANRSATRSFAASVDMVAGRSHLEVRGDLPESLWPQVAAVPGVSAVTGLVEAVVPVVGADGEYLRVMGLDIFSAAPFQTFRIADSTGEGSLPVSRWFSEPGGVALSEQWARRRRLTAGGVVNVLSEGRELPLTVLAAVREGADDAPVGDIRIAPMDIGWAQELLAKQGRLTSLQILLREPERPDPVIQAIRGIAPPDARVAAPSSRGRQVDQLMAAFHLNLSALSAVSLLVGVFLIYNTVSATVARRQIEVGILRAVGAGPWQIRALFLGEAALIGLIGGLLGIGVGMIASGAVTQAVSQTVSSLYVLTRVETVALEPWHFALAFAAGVGAAVAGAWVPAAEAAKIAPSTVLACGRRSVASKEKVAGWLLPGVVMLSAALVAGWCALTVAPPWVAFAGAFFVLAGASCFSPKLTGFMSGAVAWISHSGPPVLRLAADNLGRSLRRNAVTVAALGAAVAMAVGLMVMIHSFRETLVAWVGKGIIADLFIAPVANETLGLVATVPRDARAWLAAQPGVRAVDAFREEWVRVTLPDGKTVETALAAVWGDYRGNLLFREGNEIEAMRRAFRGEAIVINESLARKYRVQLGQELAIHTPSGVRKLVVAGVYADYSRESGCVFIGGGEFEKWFNNSAPFSLAVFFEPGLSGSKEELESAFRKQFGIGTAIAVYSNRELRGRILAIFDQTFAVTYLLRTVAVIVAIAGIVLSFTALVVERRQETGVFRSLGASPLQVVALFVWEAVWLGVAASVLGIASGAALAVVLTSVVNPAFFGWTIPLQWPVGALAVFPLWIVASSSVAALLPTWRASRENIAESVRSE